MNMLQVNNIRPVIKNFKDYVNKKYKLIGFISSNNKVVFNECKDEVIVFKFLCDKDCHCDNLIEVFRGFTARYNLYYEHNKFSLNGHILLHEFKVFVSC